METNSYFRLTLVASLFAAAAVQAQTYTFCVLPGQMDANNHPLLNNPYGVAVDSSGNVYVADTGNHVIRIISSNGVMSTLSDLRLTGQASSFSFNSPMGVAVDTRSNIYVSDNNSIYEVTQATCDGMVTPIVGPTQGNQNGETENVNLNNVFGLEVDSTGNIWVADQNNAAFCEVTTNGAVVTIAPTLISTGHPPGKQGDNYHFTGIALDSQNNVFLMDDTDYIHEYSPVSGFSTIWSGGNQNSSSGLAVDNSDNVHLYDGGSNAVLSISSSGNVTTLGSLPTTHPKIAGMAVDVFRNIYLVDQQNKVVIKGTASYPPFFNGQVALGSGVYYLAFTNGIPFGYYNLGDFNFPWFYHYDMGFEYFFDAKDGVGGAYLYDSSSGDFWYTSPIVFSYLYDFTLNAWLYYYPDTNNPGHYTSNPRRFYDFGSKQTITR